MEEDAEAREEDNDLLMKANYQPAEDGCSPRMFYRV